MKNCKLGLFDQFYLLLEKLWVVTLNQVLADNFNVITWANFLYFMLGSFCIWPSQPKIQKCRKTYPICRGIIDASEFKHDFEQ